MLPMADAPLAAATAAGDGESGRLDAIRRMPAGKARAAAAGELEVMFHPAAGRHGRPCRRTISRHAARPQRHEGVFDRAVAEAVARTDPWASSASRGEEAPGPKNRTSAED
jgi:hypothetical protein